VAYLAISDFRFGLDRRRRRIGGAAGSLWRLENCHVSRGGDIERRFPFVPEIELPVGATKGMAHINNQIFVFGGQAEPAGFPAGVTYQRLQHPLDGKIELERVLDVEAFDGRVYAIAQFADGSLFHYYDGRRVTSWDGIAVAVTTNDAIAASLAARIDQNVNVSASVSGTVITIVATNDNTPFVVTGSAINGGAVDDQNLIVTETQPSQPGVPQISTVEVVGTFEAADTFTVTVDGVANTIRADAAGTGTSILALDTKLYSTVDTLLYFSGVNAAENWTTSIGAGFTNIGNQGSGDETQVALAEFQGNLASFSRQSVRILSTDVDPDNNQPVASVRNSGTIAPGSVTHYGNLDVFYLSDSGIRSLQPRGVTDTVNVDDVGTQIDKLVIDQIAEIPGDVTERAVGAFEPIDGRFWMAVGSRIYVLSKYPNAKVHAWSTYELPFDVDEMVNADGRMYVRGGDTIYLYGGPTGRQEPAEGEVVATVELPFLAAGEAAAHKSWTGFDGAMTGEWDVRYLPNPNDEAEEVEVCIATDVTYHQDRYTVECEATHIAAKMTCSSAGDASITSIALHYDDKHEAR